MLDVFEFRPSRGGLPSPPPGYPKVFVVEWLRVHQGASTRSSAA
jgi:hypothetical protein